MKLATLWKTYEVKLEMRCRAGLTQPANRTSKMRGNAGLKNSRSEFFLVLWKISIMELGAFDRRELNRPRSTLSKRSVARDLKTRVNVCE